MADHMGGTGTKLDNILSIRAYLLSSLLPGLGRAHFPVSPQNKTWGPSKNLTLKGDSNNN